NIWLLSWAFALKHVSLVLLFSDRKTSGRDFVENTLCALKTHEKLVDSKPPTASRPVGRKRVDGSASRSPTIGRSAAKRSSVNGHGRQTPLRRYADTSTCVLAGKKVFHRAPERPNSAAKSNIPDAGQAYASRYP